MKAPEGRGLQDHGDFAPASGRHQQRTEPKNHSIPRGQIRTPALRALHDQQLVFDGQRFSRDRPNPAGTGEPRESDQQVGDQNKQQPHREPSFSPLRSFRKSAQQLGLLLELPIRHTQAPFLIAIVSLVACSAESSAQNSSVQKEVAKEMEDLQKLRTAEYQDFTNGMACEESNKSLGTYYLSKGLEAHDLILQVEEGHQISDIAPFHALDDGDAALYDTNPPPPRDF